MRTPQQKCNAFTLTAGRKVLLWRFSNFDIHPQTKTAFKNTMVNIKNNKPAAIFGSIIDSCSDVLLLLRFLSIMPRLVNLFWAAHSSDKSEQKNQDQCITRKPIHIPAESSKGWETTFVAVATSFERVNGVTSFELPRRSGNSTNRWSERSTTLQSVSTHWMFFVEKPARVVSKLLRRGDSKQRRERSHCFATAACCFSDACNRKTLKFCVQITMIDIMHMKCMCSFQVERESRSLPSDKNMALTSNPSKLKHRNILLAK